MWQKFLKLIQRSYLFLGVYLANLPALADLPKPPDSDIANDTNDWIDVGGSMTYKVLHYGLIALGSLLLGAAAVGIFNAWRTSQREQDLNHFYKHGAVAVAAAAIGLALAYAGYQIVPST